MKERRFNKYLNSLIIVNEGEQFCKKCRGEGRVPNGPKFRRPFLRATYLQCDVCLGSGKLDWVEKATGKVKERNYVKPHAPHSK